VTIDLPTPASLDERWPVTLEDFERRVTAEQDGLVHFARCRLGNQQDAEDVVQDVLVQAWRQRDRLSAVARFRPYVYRMVANRCTDLLRRRSRTVPFAPKPVTAVPAAADVGELLQQLPRDQAEVLRLRVWTGLSFAEIAEAMQSSVPTAKSRFRYAIEKLRTLPTRGDTR
jgi:RNA polymerase sigma-70 factor, ECF subfamily